MVKNKLLILSAMVMMLSVPVSAEDLSDVTHPKSPAYRLGISAFPERQFIQAQQERTNPEKKYAKLDNSQENSIADITYADLSIKNLSKEIAQDLEFDEQNMIADLSLLWQGAAQQSDTINFALYKLANPDADKPNEKSVKNVLKTIASMSTIVGASMGNPLLAGSSLLGGNIFGIMSQDTKALNYKYTRVTDADMIILIRKIEDLQQNAVNLYYDYISARKQLDLVNDLVQDRQSKFELAQKNNAQRELVVITDAYYRTALDKQRTAKSEFFAKRAALEQFVGVDTFLQFESEYIAREKGESLNNQHVDTKKVEQNITSENSEYNETIKTVENFTSGLENSTKENLKETPVETVKENKLYISPAMAPLEGFEYINDGLPTGLAAGIQDIFGFQSELNGVEKERKKAQEKAKDKLTKEEKRLAKLAEKEKKEADKALAKQIKQDEKNKKLAQKQLAKKAKKDDKLKTQLEEELTQQSKQEAKAQKKAQRKLEKQAKKEKKIKENVMKGNPKTEISSDVEEKKTRAQIRAEKKEAKRIAKEKELLAKEARKKKGPLKGIIFLHGQDKSVYRDYHYFTENPPAGQPVSTSNKKDKKAVAKQSEQENLQSQQVDTQVPAEIEPLQTVAPARKQTPSELMGLPPLDAIKAPELTRGGYSIHSDY